jgi:membrane-bound lytic murein transglycosylase D
MPRHAIRPSLILLLATLSSVRANAQDAASAPPGPGPSPKPAATAPASDAPPAASAAEPGPKKNGKAAADKPTSKKQPAAAAKPKPKPAPISAKDKAATLKKKPRAPGPAHAPDPAVRRAIAGAPSAEERARPVETPELAALREAERELFAPPSDAALAGRAAERARLPSLEPDRPAVFASGLPPPTHLAPEPSAAPGAPAPWLRSLSPTDIPARWSERVVRYLELYKHDARGRSIAAAWLKRSGAYDAAMRRVLRANGVPEDLVWVALVESGFSPTAISHAGAAGLWQLMPGTARLYGLVVDRWIDERLDPERSTVAAAKLLADLHQRFGTWELALAAYNMGFGGLLTAVRKYNTNDFAELSRFEAGLPWETTLYVPKIVAFAIVSRNLAVFGLEGVVRDAPVEADTIEVAPGVAVSSVAAAAEVDAAKVLALNPQLLSSRVPPQAPQGASSSLWPLRVPSGSAAKVSRNLVKLRAQEPKLERYVVRYGDSLVDIAAGRAVSPRELARLNALDPDDVPKPGSVLLVPPRLEPNGGSGSENKPVVVVAADLRPPQGYRRLFYRIVAGDTLAAIAAAFGVTADDLRRWNLLDPAARLQEAMTLLVLVPESRDVSGIAARTDAEVRVLVVGTDEFFAHFESLRDRVRTTLVVGPADTWQTLSHRTGLSVGMLERINRRSRSERLRPGERLVVYVPAAAAPRPPQRPKPEEPDSPSDLSAPAPEDLPELPETSGAERDGSESTGATPSPRPLPFDGR